MIALFENKGWCYLKASWKLVFRSALKEQQLIIYILFVYFVYLDVITYSLDSINSCSINDATLGAVRAIMLACLAESWQESTKLITWSITWPLMLKSYPSNPCNPWSKTFLWFLLFLRDKNNSLDWYFVSISLSLGNAQTSLALLSLIREIRAICVLSPPSPQSATAQPSGQVCGSDSPNSTHAPTHQTSAAASSPSPPD